MASTKVLYCTLEALFILGHRHQSHASYAALCANDCLMLLLTRLYYALGSAWSGHTCMA